jgi:HNH endonuclease
VRRNLGRGPKGETVPAKLARKSIVRENGCHEWDGATDGRWGYGSIAISGVMRKAHRVAWEVANGVKVPAGKVVRHTCDNPPCVNPAHLVLGTQRQNVQDMFARNRADRRGEGNNSAVLTWPLVRQIRALRSTGARTEDLARQFGVCKSQIRNIINNHHWKEERMSITTVSEAIAHFGVDVLDHLDRQAEIPVLAGLQFQGDVAVVPVPLLDLAPSQADTPVPPSGFPVVRGEAGNTHLLLAQGDVCFDAHDSRGSAFDLRLGVLTVAPGATAYLAHPEHSYAGIAPGTYEIRRQREQADEIRLVQD